MEKLCKNCKHYSNNHIKPTDLFKYSACTRYPKWVSYSEEHYCGEFKKHTTKNSDKKSDRYGK